MTLNEITRAFFLWLFYVLLHIFIIRNWVFIDHAFCFFYLGAILFLPAEISALTLLFIGFGTGLIIDSFDNTLGLHTASTTLVAFLRPYIVNIKFVNKNNDTKLVLSLKSLGISNFLAYTLILVSFHSVMLLFLDIGSFSFFISTSIKIFSSIIFTTFIILLSQVFIR